MKGVGSCSLGVGSEGTEIGWGFRTNRASGRGVDAYGMAARDLQDLVRGRKS